VAEVRIEGVTKRFGTVAAVRDLTLTVADGEFVVLLGPTGAGKTTTLRLVAGLEKPDEGRVVIGGRDISGLAPAERDVAFVFQQYSLYPHLSVYDNLAFPLRSPARRVPEPEIKATVTRIATMLKIAHKLENRATKLSGGEMQRVAIGRALVRRPSVYLMDEPLSSLDAKLRSDLRLELKRIQQDLGVTILYVTHDQIEAMTMASRIGVMEEGRLVQVGTPREIYERPATVYVATRLGQPHINLVPPSVFPGLACPPGTATVGARTEHIVIARSANGGAGVVERIEHLGDQNHLHVAVGEHRLVTLVDPDAGLGVGDRVTVAAHNPLFFSGGGQIVGNLVGNG